MHSLCRRYEVQNAPKTAEGHDPTLAQDSLLLSRFRFSLRLRQTPFGHELHLQWYHLLVVLIPLDLLPTDRTLGVLFSSVSLLLPGYECFHETGVAEEVSWRG